MKVTIEFETSSSYGGEIIPNAERLSNFFYGVDDGQVSIKNLKVIKTSTEFDEGDEDDGDA